MKNLFTKFSLIITILLLTPISAFASEVRPNDIAITNVHFGNSLYYVEVSNKSNNEIDLSGFEIISENNNYLYPEKGTQSFIIPKDYSIIFSNNITKLESTLTNQSKTVLVEIPGFKTNKFGGEIQIKDQMGVLLDSYTYESFVDVNTLPDPIFITESSKKNNIHYDYFDSLFLDVEPSEVIPETIVQKKEQETLIQLPEIDPQTSMNTENPNISVNGFTIAISLFLSFVIFFTFKYLTHNKKTYSLRNI